MRRKVTLCLAVLAFVATPVAAVATVATSQQNEIQQAQKQTREDIYKKAILKIGEKYSTGKGKGNKEEFFAGFSDKIYENFCAAGSRYVIDKALKAAGMEFPKSNFHNRLRVRGVKDLYRENNALYPVEKVKTGEIEVRGAVITWKSSVHRSHVALALGYDSKNEKFDVVNFNWGGSTKRMEVSIKDIEFIGDTLQVSRTEEKRIAGNKNMFDQIKDANIQVTASLNKNR